MCAYPGFVGFGINGAELVVLLLVIVIVAGPQKLPEFAQQLARLTRELKKLASGAQERVREELGPEFDDVDLTVFDPRQYDPRRIVRDALLEDEKPRARPRPRADRRGSTAPRPPVRPAGSATPAPPSGSTAIGGMTPLAQATQASATQRSAASGVPDQAPVRIVGGPTGHPDPSPRATATDATSATATQAHTRPSAAPPAPAAGSGPAPAGAAAILSPQDIVARTRGVRPAAESPAVIATLGAVGITAAQIAQSHGADQARAADAGRTEAGRAEASPSPAPVDRAPDDQVQDEEYEVPFDDYEVPFDDEAT